jgi:hypothetical protein
VAFRQTVTTRRWRGLSSCTCPPASSRSTCPSNPGEPCHAGTPSGRRSASDTLRRRLVTWRAGHPQLRHRACRLPPAPPPKSYALARRRTRTPSPSERRSASEMSRQRLVVQRTRPPAASTPHSAATAGSNSSASARRSTRGELDIVGELHVSPTVVGGEGCRKGEILHGLGDGGGE